MTTAGTIEDCAKPPLLQILCGEPSQANERPKRIRLDAETHRMQGGVRFVAQY